MKNMLRKTVGVMLLLLILFSTFTACVNDNTDANDPSGDAGENQSSVDGSGDNAPTDTPNTNQSSNGNGHTHVFLPKADENGHYTECDCGEITSRTDHTFEWVVDVEPTYTSPGVKHKECTCGKKSDEDTGIERLLHEEEHQVGLVVDFPNKEIFSSKEKIVEFYEENENKINGSFLCIDVSSKPEKGIYITLSPVDHYGFYYDEEHENEYISPYIVVSYGIYSNELGPNFDETVDGGESVSFVMYFYNIKIPVDYFQLEFYTIKNCENALDNVVQVMNGGICIGTIYYGSDVYIDREWMVDYLLDNLFFIN